MNLKIIVKEIYIFANKNKVFVSEFPNEVFIEISLKLILKYLAKKEGR